MGIGLLCGGGRLKGLRGAQADVEEFIRHVLDADHPELCEWFFGFTAPTVAPYSELRADHPMVIQALKEALNFNYPGIW